MQTMTTIHNPSPKTDLAVTQVLAQLLERLEHSAAPVGAEQYRSVPTGTALCSSRSSS